VSTVNCLSTIYVLSWLFLSQAIFPFHSFCFHNFSPLLEKSWLRPCIQPQQWSYMTPIEHVLLHLICACKHCNMKLPLLSLWYWTHLICWWIYHLKKTDLTRFFIFEPKHAGRLKKQTPQWEPWSHAEIRLLSQLEANVSTFIAVLLLRNEDHQWNNPLASFRTWLCRQRSWQERTAISLHDTKTVNLALEQCQIDK